MNVDSQQFKDLLKQADIQLVYWDDSPRLYVKNMTSDQRLAKFAELIVKECVSVLDPNGEYTEKYKNSHTPGPDGLRQVLSHEHFHEMMAANKLKKHFGVEE